MANHPSAQKRNRQRIKRTDRNKAVRSTVRTELKKARAALADGNKAEAEPQVKKASLALARAVSKGVVHQRTASRTTSRIQSQLAKLS